MPEPLSDAEFREMMRAFDDAGAWMVEQLSQRNITPALRAPALRYSGLGTSLRLPDIRHPASHDQEQVGQERAGAAQKPDF